MTALIETKKRVPSKLNNPLAHSFGFDFGDLQDNRSGFISHWQKKRLRWYLLSYTISIVMWIIFLAALPLALSLEYPIFEFLALLWFGIVLVVFGMFWLHKIRSVYLDLRRGKVAELISDVRYVRQVSKRRSGTLWEARESSETDYYIQIGYERFIATQEQMQSFKEGCLYHIYVAPESRQILSAELRGSDDKDVSSAFLFEKMKSNTVYTLVEDDESDLSTQEK